MLELGLIPTEVHKWDGGLDGVGVTRVRNYALGRGAFEQGWIIASVAQGRLLKLLLQIRIHFNCVLLLVKIVCRGIVHRVSLIVLRWALLHRLLLAKQWLVKVSCARTVIIQPRNSDALLSEATWQELVHVSCIVGASPKLQVGRVVEDLLRLGRNEKRILFS